MKAKKLLSTLAAVAVIGAIGYFLARTLVTHWDEVSRKEIVWNPWLLALSALAFMGNATWYAWIWKVLIERFGDRLSFKNSWLVQTLSELVKFVPGKVWHYAGRLYIYERLGVRKSSTLIAMAVESGVVVVSGTIVFLCSSPFWRPAGNAVPSRHVALAVVLAALSLVLLHPRLMERGLNFALARLKRSDRRVQLTIRYRDILLVCGLFCISWLIIGVGVWCLVASFREVDLSFFPVAAGCTSIAWVMGFVVLIAPRGLGVQEGVLTGLLAALSVLAKAEAVLLSLAFRAWTTIVLVVLALIALGIAGRDYVARYLRAEPEGP